MDKDIKEILRDNVLALLAERGGELAARETGVTRLTNLGIALGNAQRVLNAKTSIGLDLLAQLARVLGVKSWQLLVPGLEAKQPQELTADKTAWPLPMVDRGAYYALGELDRVFVQGSFSQAISDRASKQSRPAA